MAASDNIVLVDSTAAARTITLPAPTNGRVLFVKDLNGTSASHHITINPFASETIDGASSYVLSTNYASVEFTSDGTNWSVLADNGSVTSGTVTSVSVVTANGLAGTVANASSTPAITLSTTVTGILQGNGTAISAASTTGSGNVVLSASPTLTGTITAGAANFSGAISASNFSGSSSGTNTGDQTITLTGDVTGSGTGSFATTLATVNSNVGSFGSSTAIPNFTVNAKGLITAAGSSAVIAPAGTLSGTTLNSSVVNSSLTSVGTLTSLTVSGTISASNFSGSSSGTNTGDVTLAAFGSSPNADAASLSGQVLTLQPASASFPGGVSITTQTFAGDKTFTGNTQIAYATASQATIGIIGSSAQHQINGGLVLTTNTVSANYAIV